MKGKNYLKFLQQISVYYQFQIVWHSWCPNESSHKLSAVDAINDIFTGATNRCIIVMCCHNVARSSKDCLMLSFIRMQHTHSLTPNAVYEHSLSRQEFFKCYRFLLHVFWVMFFPFYLPRAIDHLFCHTHTNLPELFPLNLFFVYIRDSYFFSFFSCFFFLPSFVRRCLFSQVNHKKNAFAVVKCMFYRAI